MVPVVIYVVFREKILKKIFTDIQDIFTDKQNIFTNIENHLYGHTKHLYGHTKHLYRHTKHLYGHTKHFYGHDEFKPVSASDYPLNKEKQTYKIKALDLDCLMKHMHE